MTFPAFFTPNDFKFYKEQGYFVSQQPLLSEEDLIAFQELCARLIDKNKSRSERAFVHDLHVKHPDFLYYVLQNDLLDMVESILGRDFGFAWSAALIKNKNSDFSLDWHSDFYQDSFVEELKDHPLLSVNIAATNATRESGCIQFIPKSHLIRTNRKLIPPTSEGAYQEVFAETKPGHFTLHDCHTLHRSAPNNANYDRILINFWFISTEVSRLSTDAVNYLKTQKAGRIHLRGEDREKICALSIKSL